MKKIKVFVRTSCINHHRKNQLGNTLIPVIIALAISAVASIAFLKQGTNLADQNKQLQAQYELADVLQQWNRITSTKSINLITSDDLLIAGVDALTYTAGNARTRLPASASGPAPGPGPGPATASSSIISGSIFDATSILSTPSEAHLRYGPFKNLSSCEKLKNTFNYNLTGIFNSDCAPADLLSNSNYYLYIYVN